MADVTMRPLSPDKKKKTKRHTHEKRTNQIEPTFRAALPLGCCRISEPIRDSSMTIASDPQLIELCRKVRRLCDIDSRHSFPYGDCRKLFREAGEAALDLIPALDLHASFIAGYCGRGQMLAELSSQQISRVRSLAGRSFFEKNPAYAGLRPVITQTDVPELFAFLDWIEEMRLLLMKVIDRLEARTSKSCESTTRGGRQI
jgi:hypothetical protein